MRSPHLSAADLEGKIMDAHSHAGVALGVYGRAEFPYAQTIEGLYYQQCQGRVDVNIVFPFTSELYFDLPRLVAGRYVKARTPVSPVPYKGENLLLLRELFDYCPEISKRFVPFVSVDPLRETRAQRRALETLLKNYPAYGIKVNPALCQAPVAALLKEGRCLLDLAREYRWPLLLHASASSNDAFSYVGQAFHVIDAFPDLRFCLAHSLLFHKALLDAAMERPNVWVDTSAFKISVDVVRKMLLEGRVARAELVDADFEKAEDVFACMCASYGQRLLWGSDSPAYAYICRRKRNKTEWQSFSFKGIYEQEVRFLHDRPAGIRARIAGRNTLQFLFGHTSSRSKEK